MTDWFRRGSEEFERDVALAEALRALDPETHDPGYWLRFRGWVLSEAAAELARRRLIVDLTIGDVLTAWARTLIPTAAFAAGMAMLFLLRAGDPTAGQVAGVEELLVTDLPSETVPVLLSPDAAAGLVAFASDAY